LFISLIFILDRINIWIRVQKLRYKQRIRKKEEREFTNDGSIIDNRQKHIINLNKNDKLNTIIKCKFLDMDEYLILPNGYEIVKLNEHEIENLEQIDGFIFKRRATFINKIDELNKYNFDNSTIISVQINSVNLDISQYINLLGNIYTHINDGTKIIKNSVLDIKTIEIDNKNYIYLSKIGISVKKDRPKNILIELMNQCIRNNINIVVEIKLIDNSIIIIKNLKKDGINDIKIEKEIPSSVSFDPKVLFSNDIPTIDNFDINKIKQYDMASNISSLKNETIDDNDQEL